MKQIRKQIRFILLLLACVGPALFLPPQVLAHANVIRSLPAQNSELDEPPERVTIWFTEPLAPGFGDVQVLDAQGRRVDNNDAAVTGMDPSVMSVSLPPLPNGTYVVAWSNVSTVDGHKVRGSFLFSVGQPLGDAPPMANQPQPLFQSPLEPALRWLTLLTILVVVGGLGFDMLVLRPVLPAGSGPLYSKLSARLFKVIWMALGLFLATSIAHLLVQTMVTYDKPLWQVLGRPLVSVLVGTGWGFFWLWRIGLLLVMPAVLDLALILPQTPASPDGKTARSRQYARVTAIAAGAAILLTISLTSHAAATTGIRAAAIFNDYLHLLAAAFWVGGLAHFGLGLPVIRRTLSGAKRRAVLSLLAGRFSVMAALSVGVLVVTGLFSSWAQVTALAALPATPYGIWLLVKLGLVGGIMAAAAANLLWVRPRLAENNAAGKWLRRLVAAEMALAVLLLLAVGLLTALEPARQVASREGLGRPQQATFYDTVEGANITLAVEPGKVGPNKVTITLQEYRNGPITNATDVSLSLSYLEADLGNTTVTATHSGKGQYVIEDAPLSLAGEWQAALVVRRPDSFDARTAFRFQVAAAGAGSSTTIAPSPETGRFLWGVELVLVGILLITVGLPRQKLRLRAGPVVAIAAAAATLAGLLLVSGGLFFEPDGRAASQPDITPPAKSQADTSRPGAESEAATPVPVKNPIAPDTGSLTTGRRLFEQTCVPCHGHTGRGDGLQAKELNPPPADLMEHIPIHPDAEMFGIIFNGRPGTAMPAFGQGRLSGEEIWHLINYLKVFEADQRLAETYYTRGVAFAEQGNTAQAIDNFNQALKLSPDYAEAYNDRGLVYGQLGRFDQAITDHNRAIELKPGYETAFYYRGLTHYAAKNINQAISDYTKAIELKPGYTYAYYGRGLAYADSGNLEQAIRDFDRVIELYAGYGQVYLDRGLAHYTLGHPAQARSDLEQYLELVPESEYRQVVTGLLAQMETASAGASSRE